MGKYDEDIQLLIDKVEGFNDMRWDDLVSELGLNIHPDSLRKSFNVGKFSGYNVAKYYQQQLLNQNCDTEEELAKLEQARDKVFKEKIKLGDKRREYNKTLREEARYENLLDALKEHMGNLPYLNIKQAEYNKGTNVEATLLLSDIHYGLKVDNVLNYYDIEICKQRLESLCQKIIQQVYINRIETLHIALLGDLICGNIHLQSMVESEEDTISQILDISEILSQFVVRLKSVVPNIKIYGVQGNHSRVSRKKQDSLIVENYERLIFKYINLRTNIPVITNGLEDWLYVKINNNKVFMSHGDRDSIKKVKTNAINLTKEVPDFIYLGHVHHMMMEDDNGTDIIVNGSVISTDSFAMSIRVNTKPYQIMQIFNGDDTHLIKLMLN